MFHRPIVRWDKLPTCYEYSLDTVVYNHFKSIKFNVAWLVPELWAIVCDFLLHGHYYVSLPCGLFQEKIATDATHYSPPDQKNYLIKGDVCLANSLTRFFGLENGGKFTVNTMYVNGYGNLPLRELDNGEFRIYNIKPDSRFLFKFDSKLCGKTWVFHLWPTHGKIFTDYDKFLKFSSKCTTNRICMVKTWQGICQWMQSVKSDNNWIILPF